MPAEDRPYTVGDYRTEVIVIARPVGGVEIRRPDMDEPVILEPGEQMRFGFAAGVSVEGYIAGVGWESR